MILSILPDVPTEVASFIVVGVIVWFAWSLNREIDRRRKAEVELVKLQAAIERGYALTQEIKALEDWPHQLCLKDQQGRTVEHLSGCPRDMRGRGGERDPPPPE